MNTQKPPRFNVGDTVKIPRNLCNETEGEVIQVERLYQEFNLRTNAFIPHGLCTSESTIKACQLPYEFDGETLTVHYPERDFGSWIEKAHSSVSKFKGYSVHVKSPKLCTILNETSCKLIKKASPVS